MCQIALSKVLKKCTLFFFTVVTAVTAVTVVTVERTIMQTFHKKIFSVLCTLGKSNLTHLTTDVMFSGQRFVILAMFFGGEVA